MLYGTKCIGLLYQAIGGRQIYQTAPVSDERVSDVRLLVCPCSSMYEGARVFLWAADAYDMLMFSGHVASSAYTGADQTTPSVLTDALDGSRRI